MTAGLALAAILEAETPRCDMCHRTRGVRFVDCHWACEACRLLYLAWLALEPWRGRVA